jgi:hypothetical protein
MGYWIVLGLAAGVLVVLTLYVNAQRRGRPPR